MFSLFINWDKSSEGETGPINVYTEEARRQVVFMAATNSVTDSLIVKAVKMLQKIFVELQPHIIRVHATHIEKQVVESTYLQKRGKYVVP